MEDLLKLESDDTIASRDVASRIQSQLKSTRDPVLLGELVEFFFKTYSRRARKILTTLRETHSQDFFDKLNECIWSRKILPVFKLLAHALNSQTTWLYRVVDHPLFSSILQQLEESEDVMVLSMGLLVVAAILPLVPTYIDAHLNRIFHIFCDLATIKTSSRLGLTPRELVLHLEVSVYYLFLQLYALFPCNLFSFFKNYCETSSRMQVDAFQEFIAPLFHQVQLHPGLVTDSCAYELSKAKWGAMEPSEIATHSIQLCRDCLLNSLSPGGAGEGDRTELHQAGKSFLQTPTSPLTHAISRPSTLNFASSLTSPPPPSGDASSGPPQGSKAEPLPKLEPVSSPGQDPTITFSLDEPPAILSGPPNPGGLKTSEELCQYWSPSVSLGKMSVASRSHSESASHRSSRTSVSRYSQPGGHPYSALSSPNSDSAVSSTLHTPAPGAVPGVAGGVAFSFKNYSPTASVDGESLMHGARQALTQSAVMSAPTRLDESFHNGHMDPLSQSVQVGSAAPKTSRSSSPIKKLQPHRSFRNRLGRFFGLFQKEEEGGEKEVHEDFLELFSSDENIQREGTSSTLARGKEEVGQEVIVPDESQTVAMEIERNSSVERSGTRERSESGTEVDCRCSGTEGAGVLEGVEDMTGSQLGEIDLSTLPPVSRPSRSGSDASQTSTEQPYNFRDSPNAAGAGHFNYITSGQSYNEVGASITSANTRMSSSYPRSTISRVTREGVAGESGQRHASNSETEINSRAYEIQEKLQKLVEHKEIGGVSNVGGASVGDEGGAGNSLMDSQTPVLVGSGTHNPPPSSADREGGATMAVGPPPLLSLQHGFAMRRLSVCSRRGVGQRFVSESSSAGCGTATITEGSQSSDPPLSSSLLMTQHPSPLALLDQFVRCGEVIHHGHLDTIPLTEQEGVDWNHFGGCPHSEEFRIMQSQVVLLHSQLLFERYQCVQHAKRNRRLLSKARSAAHVTEELVSLRDQLHQRDQLVESLQQELGKVTVQQHSLSKQQLQERAEESSLARESTRLKDENRSLSEELWRMAERNRKLEEELKSSKERLFNLTTERAQLEPRLRQADQLQAEMSALVGRYQRLEEQCRKQKDHMTSLQSHAHQGSQWQAHCSALLREKEEGVGRIHALQQALEACEARLGELEVDKKRKEVELKKLRQQLEEERGQAWAKVKAVEEKYGSMKVIGQQLECHVLELKSHTPVQQRKKVAHGSRHRRNVSSTSSTTTPSPAPGVL